MGQTVNKIPLLTTSFGSSLAESIPTKITKVIVQFASN